MGYRCLRCAAEIAAQPKEPCAGAIPAASITDSAQTVLTSVDLATEGDSRDQDKVLFIVHGVDDPVVANPDSVVVTAGQLRSARRSRFIREVVDGRLDPAAKRIMKPPIRTSRLPMEPDLVPAGGQVSSARISDHGTDVSRSSRARRAARLSSR